MILPVAPFLTITPGANVRHFRRGTDKARKFLLPVVGLPSDRFEHVVPEGVRRPGVTLLAQVEAVVGHVAEVGVPVWLLREAQIADERLHYDAKVRLAVELRPVGNVLLQPVPALDDLDVTLALACEPRGHEAGTF